MPRNLPPSGAWPSIAGIPPPSAGQYGPDRPVIATHDCNKGASTASPSIGDPAYVLERHRLTTGWGAVHEQQSSMIEEAARSQHVSFPYRSVNLVNLGGAGSRPQCGIPPEDG